MTVSGQNKISNDSYTRIIPAGGLPHHGNHGRALDACWLCAWRHEHRQHVYSGVDDRLWAIRLDRQLRSSMDAQHDGWECVFPASDTEPSLAKVCFLHSSGRKGNQNYLFSARGEESES